MKRLIALLLCVIVALFAVGCKKTPEPVVTPDVPSADSSVPAQSDTVSEAESEPSLLDGADPTLTAAGNPEFSAQLQKQFAEAQSLYSDFCLCRFPYQTGTRTTINGMEFNRIKDSRFSTYEELKTLLAKYFTQQFVSEQLLNDTSCVQEGPDGYAYVLEAGIGSNVLYAGHTFDTPKATEDKITFTATVYYAEDPVTGTPFYTAPADDSKYTKKAVPFELVKTNDGWQYDKFAYLAG